MKYSPYPKADGGTFRHIEDYVYLVLEITEETWILSRLELPLRRASIGNLRRYG